MRRSVTIGHGPVAMPLAAAERLRVYRRCFHELEEQLSMMQAGGGRDSSGDVRKLQAELRSLEELIMVFTDLNPAAPTSKQMVIADAWMAKAAMEGLDLSLVTDMLMLSATSPWTMYIAERNQDRRYSCGQWLLSYVSPSTKRTTGWMPQELIGTAAWSACHPDDIPTLQRMLHLKDSEAAFGGSVIYRRMRKDRSYVTVQATGRAVGTRWYAWVEQDILNFSLTQHQEDHAQVSQNKGVPRAVGVPKPTGESADSPPAALRARRPSEVPNPQGELVGGGSRPISPVTPLSVLERLQAARNKGKAWAGLDPDEATEKPRPLGDTTSGSKPLQQHVRGKEVVATPPLSTDFSAEQGEVGPAAAKFGPATEEEDRVALVAKGKAAIQRTPKSSQNPLSQHPGADLLKGRKVLLVEDDVVNRKIGQRLLQSLDCRVTVTCNGQEALDVLRAPSDSEQVLDGKELPSQFDLVLMDLQMPVMDGTHAVQLFREWEEEQDPPRKRMTVFALTANVSDRDMVKCAQSGFDEFVSKPLTLDKLVDRLKKINPNSAANYGLNP